MKPDDVVFCGETLLDSRSPPLASESTEADDNNSGHRMNSMSPPLCFPADGSAPLVLLKHSPHPFVSGTSAAGDLVAPHYSNQSWSIGEKKHAYRSPRSSNNGKGTSQPLKQQQSATTSAGTRPRGRPATSRLSSPASSDWSPALASEAPASSSRAFGVEDDDGVAVYIDNEEDGDCFDGIVITEHRISARRAAEVPAYKSKWVTRMLLQRDRILGVSSGKAKDRTRKNITGTGHGAITPSEADCGPEFLQRKLEGFAACMAPEALECIERQDRRWRENSSDSDEASSASDAPHPTRRRPSNTTLEGASPAGHRIDPATKSNAFAGVLKHRRRLCHGKEGQLELDSSAVALRAWGRFLKYVRKTCKPLAPRPRIERTAGLESDDDDEQAPLYMCRPGSVQRPSPLISHSLTEHLRASNTLFFKHFARRTVSTPVSFQVGASPAAASAEEQQTYKPPHVAAPTAVQVSTARESVLSTPNDMPANADGPSSDAASRDAVPLYQITAEASAMFGDLMRLEDTMRMLDASCTFRLASAPLSTIRNKSWQLKGRARTRTPRESAKSPHWGGLCSEAQTGADGPARCTEKGRVPATSTSPRQLQVPTAGKSAAAHSRRHPPHQTLMYASSGSERGAQEKRTPNRNPSERTEDSRIVYTLQADEETLALSGLDPSYCARVEFASKGPHRARESLAHLAVPQPNGTPAQESKPASVAAQMKKRRKAADKELSSGDNESGSECIAVDEASSSTAFRDEGTDEAGHERSLMADRLLLAHLMPYLPQLGPD